jgi:hypothetical protein
MGQPLMGSASLRLFPAGGAGHSNRATNSYLPIPTFILMIMQLTLRKRPFSAGTTQLSWTVPAFVKIEISRRSFVEYFEGSSRQRRNEFMYRGHATQRSLSYFFKFSGSNQGDFSF